MNSLPHLTPEQRAAALVKAGEIRTERAKMKQAMKSGDVKPQDAMQADVMQRLHVSKFLESVPGVGPARAKAIMDRCGIGAGRRVSGLGKRQRALLLEELNALS